MIIHSYFIINTIKTNFTIIIEKCINECCWEPANSGSDGIRIQGEKWPVTEIQSVEECAELCNANVKCNGFHYYGYSDDYYGHCYLKTNVTSVTQNLQDNRERYGGICRKGKFCIIQIEIRIW